MSDVTVSKSEQTKVSAKIVLREYTESLVVAVALALFLRLFVISAYKIPTGSMVPTLKVGDFVFAYKLAYGFPIPFSGGAKIGVTLPGRGDVVVFRYPGNETVSYVKRVVGLPGDRIAIKNKKLYVNEVVADYEPVGQQPIADIPGNEYYETFQERLYGSTHFVMNNNEESGESFGPIVVPPSHIFVLGDNRDSSDDSRYWGSVPVRNLEGKVVLTWMSLDWHHRWGEEKFPTIRWERVFQWVR